MVQVKERRENVNWALVDGLSQETSELSEKSSSVSESETVKGVQRIELIGNTTTTKQSNT